jgi:predicted permease
MLTALRALWYRLKSRVAREEREADLAQELELHRALIEEEARGSGASADEAARIAAVRLGNVTSIRERTRESWSLGALESFAQDARYAVRFLRRSPVFTTVAILSLALGVGANAAVLSVVDRLLFVPPPHVADANRLYGVTVRRLMREDEERPFQVAMTFPEALALRESGRSFAAVVPYTVPGRTRLGRGPDAPRIRESMVSVDFFDVLGARPAAGRFFVADDDRADGPSHAAVISWAFWQRNFDGADSALGAHLTTPGLDFVVVGVAPAGFAGVELDAADIWVPLGAAAPVRIQPDWKHWDGFGARAVVRLREGVSPAAANAEAALILNRLPERGSSRKTRKTVAIGSLIPGLGPAEQAAEVRVSTRLAVAAVLVLIAVCANLANLLLVRALSRRREIALRLAIGISRRRLVGQLALESIFIALTGAAAAVVAAAWGGSALRALVFPDMQWATGAVNRRVAIFAVASGLIVALLATIAPAIRMTRWDVSQALRSAAPQLTASTGRLRRGLLVVQVALSVVLIVGASVFAQSLKRAQAFDMGVDIDKIVLTRLFVEEDDSLSGAARRSMLEESLRRAQRLPGIERIALANRVPLAGNTVTRAWAPRQQSPQFAVLWDITPELQQTLGFRLVRGRWMTAEDTRGARSVALVTETMAGKLWPGRDPIGSCVRFGAETSPCIDVVGVVRDVRQRSIREEAPLAALRGTREADVTESGSAYLVIRTVGDPAAFVPQLRRALRDVRPDLETIDAKPLAVALEYDYRPLRLGTAIFSTFSMLTVILAAVGLYGVLAFATAQRTGEFGIRAALGAGSRDLAAMVMREGLAIVALGFLIGGGASWWAATTIEAFLFNASGRSVAPYAGAAVVLGLAAVAASAVPALRAARVDPAVALRAE